MPNRDSIKITKPAPHISKLELVEGSIYEVITCTRSNPVMIPDAPNVHPKPELRWEFTDKKYDFSGDFTEVILDRSKIQRRLKEIFVALDFDEDRVCNSLSTLFYQTLRADQDLDVYADGFEELVSKDVLDLAKEEALDAYDDFLENTEV